MGLYVFVGGRATVLILFFVCYAAFISHEVFASAWPVIGCAVLGAVIGFGAAVMSWDDWVHDYWYRMHGESLK